MNLPLFRKRPIKVGDVYPLGGYHDREQLVKVTAKAKWDFPTWVAFEVAYLDGPVSISEFKDFMDREGRGFVNVWGVWIFRTRWEILQYQFKEWTRDQRRKLSRMIYPD